MTRTTPLRTGIAVLAAATAVLLTGCTAQPGGAPGSGTAAEGAMMRRFTCPPMTEVAALTAVPFTEGTAGSTACTYSTAADADVSVAVTVRHPATAVSGRNLATLRYAAVRRGAETADAPQLALDAFTESTKRDCTTWFPADDGVVTSVTAHTDGRDGAKSCSCHRGRESHWHRRAETRRTNRVGARRSTAARHPDRRRLLAVADRPRRRRTHPPHRGLRVPAPEQLLLARRRSLHDPCEQRRGGVRHGHGRGGQLTACDPQRRDRRVLRGRRPRTSRKAHHRRTSLRRNAVTGGRRGTPTRSAGRRRHRRRPIHRPGGRSARRPRCARRRRRPGVGGAALGGRDRRLTLTAHRHRVRAPQVLQAWGPQPGSSCDYIPGCRTHSASAVTHGTPTSTIGVGPTARTAVPSVAQGSVGPCCAGSSRPPLRPPGLRPAPTETAPRPVPLSS